MVLFEDGRSGIISQIDFAKTTPQQLKEQRNDISEVQNSTRAFNAYSKEELKTEEESVSFEPDTIAKRIAILQKEYNQCKSRLASAQNDVVRSQMKSKMNLLQGQIIALFSSAI
jgi:DNA-directed RNA polymerase alpha subunit